MKFLLFVYVLTFIIAFVSMILILVKEHKKYRLIARILKRFTSIEEYMKDKYEVDKFL